MSDQTPPPPSDGGDTDVEHYDIEPIEIQDEMENSFLEYAMSVIMQRALPDARDGLKPVHRRILWGMEDIGARPDRNHMKCARVTGHVMGHFHPHGDSAIYDALVRMAQPFSLRHPLIDFHGNYGSPDFGPAAARYTECRLSNLAMRLLDGINEETVDFTDTYSGEFTEPSVLPARFPNLLVNGSEGIAVGMATKIPPHNLGEVIDATVHLIDNPEATVDDLMQYVKGPDFPTGALMMGRQGILDAYRTGKGTVKLRAKAEIVEGKQRDKIVVIRDAVPDLDLGHRGQDQGAGQRQDHRGHRRCQRRVVQGPNRAGHHPQARRPRPGRAQQPVQAHPAADQLRHEHGGPGRRRAPHPQPSSALQAYVAHQVEVITRRSEFRLRKARDRAHIVEGLSRRSISSTRSSPPSAPRPTSPRHASASRPSPSSSPRPRPSTSSTCSCPASPGSVASDLESELAELRETIAELEAILADEGRLRQVIKDELGEIRGDFATDRKSQITLDPGDIDIEDLIDDEELVVTLSHRGYVKTVEADAFRRQGRGGRGVAGAKLRDEDFVTKILTTTAHAYLLFFSNRGKVYRLKAHEIPKKDRTARGTAIINLLQLEADETIQAIIDTRDYETYRYLFFATKQGQVKKTKFSEYDSSLRTGLIAINLRDGDELVQVIPTNGDSDIFMVAKSGMTIRFDENDVRAMGRAAAGVRGMKLKGDDEVVSCDCGRDEAALLIVTDAGYGKRTQLDKFNTQGRGGQGVRGMKLTAKKGEVVAAFMVGIDDEIFVISSHGTVIRMGVRDISSQGRDATGVKVMDVGDDERVAAVAPVLFEDDDE